MKLDFVSDLNRSDPDAWRARIEELAEEHGNFTPLDADHFAAFMDAGPKLLVTFENAAFVRKFNPDAEPRGFSLTRTEGWSHLAIISEDESWFRSEAIYRYFDRLTDDGFFDDFDQVLFHGTGSGGYAAAAYCVAAPGCNVLALRPQATLDPKIVSWDTRYLGQRRLNFNDRYGFAPDMIDAANHVYLAFDPSQRLDASHASIFAKQNVDLLPIPGIGGRPDQALTIIDKMTPMLIAAMNSELDGAFYSELLRARRDNPAYLRFLFNQMIRADHPVLAANICAHVLRKDHDDYYAEQLENLREQGHTPSRPFKPNAA